MPAVIMDMIGNFQYAVAGMHRNIRPVWCPVIGITFETVGDIVKLKVAHCWRMRNLTEGIHTEYPEPGFPVYRSLSGFRNMVNLGCNAIGKSLCYFQFFVHTVILPCAYLKTIYCHSGDKSRYTGCFISEDFIFSPVGCRDSQNQCLCLSS